MTEEDIEMSEIGGSGLPAEHFLRPGSVAIVGATEDQRKYGGRVIQLLVKHGFNGDIFPINPNRSEIFGIKTFMDVASLPSAPEIAFLAVPKAAVYDVLAQCAAKGIKGAIILASEFAETGEEGATDQRKLVAFAHANGMRILGPNCLGLFNSPDNVVLTTASALAIDRLPRGKIAFVSQSGALMISAFDRAVKNAIGFASCVSVGNQADLEVADFIEFYLQDANTGAICVYVEGIKDPERLKRLAQAAKERKKPLLLVKAGRSEAGARAAFSHTASLMGKYSVLESMAEEAGIVLMDDVDAMIMLASLLVDSPKPLRSVAVLSASGGLGALSMDRLSDLGVPLAMFGGDAERELKQHFLPGHYGNPVDLGARFEASVKNAAEAAMRYIDRDESISHAVFVLASSPNFVEFAESLVTAAKATSKPFLFVLTPGAAADAVRDVLRSRGVPFCDRLDDAVRVLSGWAKWGRLMERPPVVTVRPADLPQTGLLSGEAVRGEMGELETKDLLSRYGVPVNTGRLATSKDEAIEAAEDIGFPVVLKAVSKRIVHKSEVNGVMLNLTSREQVARAWDAIVANVERLAPNARLEGMSVQAMAQGDCELIVGLLHDSQFGPTVLVGWGGVYAEVFKDSQVAIAPVSTAQARQLLSKLKVWKVLEGVRGKPPLDVEAACDAISRISWLGWDMRDSLRELDVNPLLVRRQGQGVVAVDGRARVGG